MKTTEKHFKIFKEECERLIKLWGLTGWKVYYEHTQLQEKYASMSTDLDNQVSSIALNTEWQELRPLNDDEIRKVAKHETIHLLLARLSDLGASRYVSSLELKSAEEDIVHKLEGLL